ncbi:uncharacterized protein LOC127245654 [Andrographis paniculata]|uniref:uncharacterized protein LOC127245654 n=1 Tax=Andrographis paniculata TaxID=175694 RepID=UPI0021E7970C|nr:uncharacterized protein LOC127245654 [Andrographis paniculata]
MTNACVTRLPSIRLVPLPRKRKFGRVFTRNFSTCASTHSCSSMPLIYPSVSCMLNNGKFAASDSPPQRSDEWFALRKDKLTTSSFSTALGFWKGNRRYELWHEKVYATVDQSIEGSRKGPLEWGILNEDAAIERYKSITGRRVSSLSFAVHEDERFHWIGASPDGLLECLSGGGILEVKCPFNKGKPETMLPWSTMPFYYMPQVQGQMEVMNRDWVDLYCWTPNGSNIFRVRREPSYWELIHGVLREFWWENVVPARDAVLLGKEEEEVNAFKPASKHRLTGLVVVKSLKLAEEAKLLCKEIAGHVEYCH